MRSPGLIHSLVEEIDMTVNIRLWEQLCLNTRRDCLDWYHIGNISCFDHVQGLHSAGESYSDEQ
jgi:hypothetical protein